MKRIALLSVSIFILTNLIYSQDIINETGKDGKFIVRDSEEQEALIVDEGNVTITGALKVETLEEGAAADKVVVWSEEDKQFKALYNLIPRSTINASTMAADSWTESGSDVYRASGNVGIGIATPIYPLTVYRSGANASVVTQRDGGAINYINAAATHGTFGTVNNFPTRISQNAQIKIFLDKDNNGLYFGSNGNITAAGDPDIDMMIDTDGNVGIGTTNPSVRLHLVGGDYEGMPSISGHNLLFLQNNDIASHVEMTLLSSRGGSTSINMGDFDDPDVGIISYNNTDNSMKFIVNASERLRINSSGNIGLGTASPTSRLHVSGDMRLTGPFIDASGDAGTAGQILSSTATGTDWIAAPSGGSGDNLGNHIATQNLRLNGYWLSNDGGSEGIFVTANGNVGAGLSNPVHNLTVNNSIGIQNSSTGYGTSDGFALFNDGLNFSFYNYENGHIRFGANGSTRLQIEPNGNIGIGTITPGAKLEVAGQVKITGGSPGSGKVLTSDANGLASWQTAPMDADWGVSGNDVYGVLTTSGKLGVGIAAPLVKTHIVQNTGEGYPTLGTGTILAVQQNSSGNWADIAITSSASGASALNFGDATDFDIGSVQYRNSDNSMRFYTNTAEQVRIDSQGDVGFGIIDPQQKVHAYHFLRSDYTENFEYWDFGTDNYGDFAFNYGGPATTAWIDNVDGSYHAVSDVRFKKDIVGMPSILQKVLRLKPSNYRFIGARADVPLSTGLIAQDVQNLFPETVSEKNGYLSINYDAFGVIAIQAIKEQQEIIDQLTKRIEVLESR